MARMQDKFIDLTVTSPPYDNLRTYNGYSFDFESIAKELFRVTKEGGVVVWVVGDATSKFNESGTSFKQALYFKEIGFDLIITSPPYDNIRDYNNSSTWNFDIFKNIAKELQRVLKKGGVIVWIVNDATIKGSETGTSLKQALYFKEIGFNLLDTMIYYKQNYAPAYPTLRRYANQFEYMFIFSKGRPNTYNPIQKPKVRNKKESVAYRQKDGTLKRKIKEKGRETKDASNVWEFAVGGNLTGHPAVFPEKLANDHIISWSNEKDLIYDPFMGSGTSAKMALLSNRNYIGSEISEEYCKIANERLT